MPRAILEINSERIRHNVKKLSEFSGKKVIAVIKADAYGIGSIQMAKILEPIEEVDAFAVACVEEGVELRKMGIKKEILILGGVLKDEVPLVEEYFLTPVVSDIEHLRAIGNRDIKFHVKYDTGMGRLGFLNEVIHDPRVEGIMSHLSSPADEEFSKLQIKKFEEIVKKYTKVEKIHMESSAGVVYRVPFTTHIRVGLAMYGEKPLKNYPVDIKPALTLKAKLISVKELPENYPVSYSRTYVTKKKTKTGVVAFGYADGLMKTLSNRSYLLYKGEKLPIFGNITMDMTIVDLKNTDAKVGDWVYVVNEERTFTELAREAGTIPYELMCNLSKRIKRVVV
ncbi:alanine racemase [Aquifex aeolicus]|uniref:Alanine racemase n=1 Tax=Aquifex aeolicus (strain VF5) TaxID=224324 RepID=ALR_AQUAE|nr:alanine racemase [Aquifex aeolicus]O67687.1 RecName: Full=Alanine racemase [Aquifex aeolicus VF5]AAC07650.1 alanine racemase [Aquifex aeolicus VF5]